MHHRIFITGLLALLGAFGGQAAPVTNGGVAVVAECRDPALLEALAANERLFVIGLSTNAAGVPGLRAAARAAGLAGRVLVDEWDGQNLPFINNFVNLLYLDLASGVASAEIARVLVPRGLVLYTTSNHQSIDHQVEKPWPATIDEWSHWKYNAAGNPCSKDLEAGPLRQMQWLARPFWTKYHFASPAVHFILSGGGRVFYMVDESPSSVAGGGIPYKWALIARDAFNGKLLWRKPIASWGPAKWDYGRFYWGAIMNPGVTDQARERFAVDGDRLYGVLDYDGPVVALDAATGRELRTYTGTESCSKVYVHNGRLYFVCGTNPKLRVLEPVSGTNIWTSTTYTPYHLVLYSNQLCIMVWGSNGVHALDATTYAVRWVSTNFVASGDASAFFQTADVVIRKKSGDWMALDARNGNVLWTRAVPPKSGLLPADGSVRMDQMFATSGRIWTYVSEFDLAGFNPTSGAQEVLVNATNICWSSHHHRCFNDRATERFFVVSQNGIEFITLKGETNRVHNWTRATCNTGPTPANGLIYAPPHACACTIKSMLRGLYCYAPARPDAGLTFTLPQRLTTGPAYGAVSGGAASPDDWPLYRYDVKRQAASPAQVPRELRQLWSVALGDQLTPPVIANGRVYLAGLTNHSVRALDAATGAPLWTYYAGGVVDGPPSIWGDCVLFGCTDGRVYCLHASDGALVWRFQAAPRDCRNTQLDNVSSVWPLRASVLVESGTVYAVAGHSSRLDGGVWIYALDALTGAMLCSNRVEDVSPEVPEFTNEDGDRDGIEADLLVRDGSRLFMRHIGFDNNLVPSNYPFSGGTTGIGENSGVTAMRHMFASSGFLDDSWNQRMVWTYGGIHGQLLVVDNQNVYGVKAYDESGFSGRYSPGQGYLLFAQNALTPGGKILTEPGLDGQLRPHATDKHLWWSRVPVRVRAMARAGAYLFAAGPPDTVSKTDPLAALEGRAGGMVWTIDPATGRRIAQLNLTSPPVYDGMAAAGHCLYLTTEDGHLVCLGQADTRPQAELTVTPGVGTLADTYRFSASNSYDLDGAIVLYQWAIDGVVVSSNSAFATTFAPPGVRLVTLTVTDNDGLDGVARAAVAVKSGATPADDTDGDGLPDAWELAYIGNLSMTWSDDLDADGLNALAEYARGTHPLERDTDGDRLTDGAEVAAGTSPTNAASVVQLRGTPWDGPVRVIVWPSVAGRRYAVWATTNLVHGFDEMVAGQLPATPPLNVYTDRMVRTSPSFYQLEVQAGVGAPVPNYPPTPSADRVFVLRNTALAIAVLANDCDPDGDPLRVSAVTQPGHGSASCTSANVSYTPQTDYTGTDSFSYTAADGLGGASNALVLLSVQPYRNLLSNGQFSASINTGDNNAYSQAMANQGWFVHNAHPWQWDRDNECMYAYADLTYNALAQVLLNNANVTGARPISFRVRNTGADNVLKLKVYGISSAFSVSYNSENGPTGSTLLYDSGNVAGANFDWKDISGTVDFGAGYTYLIIIAWTDNVNPGAGDEQCLDELYLGGL